ncbi:MAG: fasciclin domain-containing protein [Sediminibacterium sp.]|nr:fasciclin domain-containing protein [Hydrotalea sp.]MCU0336238.1 fasciclin domain-containing protein [Sediminibacterium sp.]
MKRIIYASLCLMMAVTYGCNSEENSNSASSSSTTTEQVGQSGVQDDVSNPNIVQTAVGSKDHTTLVTAVKAAGLVDALSNAGPFTVFAPTNAAFDKLPKGTVEDLLKPEKKDDLTNILGYHTYVGVLEGVILQDGLEFEMVHSGKIKITREGEVVKVNGTPIVASIKTSNGVIHVIGDVLLPPSK